MTDFEKAVRHALIDRNMSVTDLAGKLGISVSYMFEIIKGTRKAEQQKERIKQFLGIGGEDDEQIDSPTDSTVDGCV